LRLLRLSVSCSDPDKLYYGEYLPPATIAELEEFLAGKNDVVMMNRLTLTKDSRAFGRTYTASFFNKLTGEHSSN